MKPFNPKPRPCSHCAKPFLPVRPLQSVCGPVCAARKVRKEKAEERAQVKTRKEAIKTIPQLIKEAQVEFNKFIRARDAGLPCICCGRPLGDAEVGGLYDCGHFRSVGSASHLRFNELNAHAQRKQCNRWGAGRAVDYRAGLIQRIGLERVLALESDNRTHKWTREELIEIRETYKRKTKELNRERE